MVLQCFLKQSTLFNQNSVELHLPLFYPLDFIRQLFVYTEMTHYVIPIFTPKTRILEDANLYLKPLP